jgi:hypothetical protein
MERAHLVAAGAMAQHQEAFASDGSFVSLAFTGCEKKRASMVTFFDGTFSPKPRSFARARFRFSGAPLQYSSVSSAFR